ncbi:MULTISPECIES: hypothetical protein [unclassified Endozoicomonas]|uniref:hypothetical protein n=1 Tax=unclassified Endozoicomonas TaxID=2644528 RepID=UPI003BB74536
MMKDLIDTARDIEEEDYIRVDALKAILLELDDVSEIIAEVRALLTLIITNRDDDILVRQHAACELYYCLGDSVPDGEILTIIADINEDIDLRVNLCEAFRGKESLIQEVIQNLKSTDELTKYT